LKRTLLTAKSITYVNPADGGASGVHFAKVLDRLGIANEMKPKTIYSKPGADTGVVVASGTAELGVNEWQVVMSVAGIEKAGPPPGDLQDIVVFASAVMSGAKDAAAIEGPVRLPAHACGDGDQGEGHGAGELNRPKRMQRRFSSSSCRCFLFARA
jgi:molybdate transport system substrate-binding protein